MSEVWLVVSPQGLPLQRYLMILCLSTLSSWCVAFSKVGETHLGLLSIVNKYPHKNPINLCFFPLHNSFRKQVSTPPSCRLVSIQAQFFIETGRGGGPTEGVPPVLCYQDAGLALTVQAPSAPVLIPVPRKRKRNRKRGATTSAGLK